MRIALLMMLLLCTGCTAHNWYEGTRMMQREQCSRNAQPFELQRCLENVDAQSYDQYENQRKALKERP